MSEINNMDKDLTENNKNNNLDIDENGRFSHIRDYNSGEKFKKNEIAIYKKTGEKVKILDVHYDDLPNIYYTITTLLENIEKQTLESYLIENPNPQPIVNTEFTSSESESDSIDKSSDKDEVVSPNNP